MMLEKIYRSQKCQIGRPLSRIEEDGRNWLRRPNLCIKSCRTIIRRGRLWREDLFRCVVFFHLPANTLSIHSFMYLFPYISIYRYNPRMWRQSQYYIQYICWITDVIKTKQSTIVIQNLHNKIKYTMPLYYYNLEYTLFLKIKIFINRIKWVMHKKPLYGLFEHFCLVCYTLYGS